MRLKVETEPVPLPGQESLLQAGAGASAPGTMRMAISLASGSPPPTRKGWKTARKQRAGNAESWQGWGRAESHTRCWEGHLGPEFGDPVGHGYCSHAPVPSTSHPGWVLKRRANRGSPKDADRPAHSNAAPLRAGDCPGACDGVSPRLRACARLGRCAFQRQEVNLWKGLLLGLSAGSLPGFFLSGLSLNRECLSFQNLLI